MNLTNLKNQILLNRRVLATMYETLAQVKADKRFYDEQDDLEAEYATHNYLKWLRKQIASIVVLQKTLKADVAYTLSIDRANRVK